MGKSWDNGTEDFKGKKTRKPEVFNTGKLSRDEVTEILDEEEALGVPSYQQTTYSENELDNEPSKEEESVENTESEKEDSTQAQVYEEDSRIDVGLNNENSGQFEQSDEKQKEESHRDEKIALIKNRIDQINSTAGQTHGRQHDEGVAEVARLENEIYKLEGSELEKDGKGLVVYDDSRKMILVGKNEAGYPTYEFRKQRPEEIVETTEEEDTNKEIVPQESTEKLISPEKAEYLSLKKEFKQSERAYYDAISQDYSNRNSLIKLFGAGRLSMTPSVWKAYDKFMEANKAYYKFAQTNGMYEKITERLNRDRKVEQKKISITPSISGRHILNPAEKRLELQTVQLPEGLKKLKEGLVSKIKSHPKTSLALAGLVVLSNPVGLLAAGTGLATRYLGNKFYVKPNEEKLGRVEAVISDLVGKFDELDLETLEQRYFETTNLAHNAKNRTNMAATVAAATAGGMVLSIDSVVEEAFIPDNLPTGEIEVVSGPEAEIGAESLPDNTEIFSDTEVVSGSENEVVPEPEPEPEIESESIAGIEYVHEVKLGENLATILFDSIKEKIATGEITLPPGVSREDLSHYMYQSFPEMTNATDVSPRLTSNEWVQLGVKSGDPHVIKLGEMIDIQTLLEKMWGSSIETVPAESVGIEVSPEVLPVSEPSVNPAYVVESSPLQVEPVSISESVPESVASGVTDVPEDVVVDSVETIVNVSEEAVPLPESSDSSVSAEGGAEISLDDFYTISTAYEEITHQFAWRETMHDYLASVIQKGMETGEITLPLNVAFGKYDFSNNLMGLVEERLPEVSSSILNFNKGPDFLTPEQWKEFGVSSGNPKNISSDDVFMPGKLFEYIVSGNKDVLLTKAE